MIIEKIECGDIGQNTYFVCNDRVAVLIDASAPVERVQELLDIYSVPLGAIFVTHAHFDHIATLDSLIDKFDCDVYIHKSGYDILYDVEKNLSYIDEEFIISNTSNIKTIEDDESIYGVFDDPIVTIHTPGHSLDSVCYRIEDIVFTGDTLFYGTVGRTDMYGGDSRIQKQSLLRLKDFIVDATRFCAGHGEDYIYSEAIDTIDYYAK